MTRTPDFSALESVTRRGVTYQPPGTGSVTRLYTIVFVGIFGAFALPFLGIVQGQVGYAGGETETPIFIALRVLFILAMAVPGALIIAMIVRGFRSGSNLGQKLPAFAAANGFTFEPNGESDLPGSLFTSHRASWIFSRLTRTTGRELQIGNVGTWISTGRSRTVDTWGYLALRLDRPLPHILLEAVASGRNTMGELPVSVDPNQRVSLEGDFDRHFTLYCPADYAIDALSILTPDVMALLIDESGGWHVEIVDDWLFVYSPDDFVSGASADTYRRLLRIAELIGAKTLRRSQTYRDDRVTAPAVVAKDAAPEFAIGPDGQRMEKSAAQDTRLFRVSLGLLVGIIVVFIVGVFVSAGIVVAVYGAP